MRNDIVRKAIELGHLRGIANFDQLNGLIPSTTTSPEDIETVMEALSDGEIRVIEDN